MFKLTDPRPVAAALLPNFKAAREAKLDDPNQRLSPDELIILDLLAKAYNKFIQLPTQHPCDQDEFVRTIHEAQRMIGIRLARRMQPRTFVADQQE